ncbi:MAG TPA: hypothetical protein PKG98_09555 [Myxococcota bacterium]|nr:hypothetical protein [Myxococcota bacterium]
MKISIRAAVVVTMTLVVLAGGGCYWPGDVWSGGGTDVIEVNETYCEPDARICHNGDVYKCTGDGKNYVLLMTCDEGCESGVCTGCQPDCGTRECGPDPVCGTSCGNCTDGKSCQSGSCVTGLSVVWQDDFESYSAGDFPSSWVPDANATDSSSNFVDDTVFSTGNQSLRLFGKMGGCWGALAYRSITVDPPFELEVDVKNGTEDTNGCHPDRATIGVINGTDWSNWGRSFAYFKKDGSINGPGGVVATYSTNVWMKLRVRYERLGDGSVKLTYWVNGTLVGSQTDDPGENEDYYDNVQLVSQEGSVWYDNVRVYH